MSWWKAALERYRNILLNRINHGVYIWIIEPFLRCLNYIAIPYLYSLTLMRNRLHYQKANEQVKIRLTWWRTSFLVYQWTSIVLPPLSDAKPTCKGCDGHRYCLHCNFTLVLTSFQIGPFNWIGTIPDGCLP